MRTLYESGFRPNRPPKGETPKRFEDPKWVQNMTLVLDYNYAMAEFLGASGLTDTDLSDLTPRLVALDQDLAAAREHGQAAFLSLPLQTGIITELRQVAKPLLEWCWDLAVLGPGSVAAGVRALHQALRHPQHNKFPMARRQHKLGLWVADTIDPDSFYGLLDGLDLRRACFHVVSPAGDNPETLAQFLWVYNLMKKRFGEDQAKERLIITSGPESGPLQSLAARERLTSLAVPPGVPGPLAVLSAAGLLPAHLAGIDVAELLAGAGYMAQRLQDASSGHNPACRLAALFYLFATAKTRPILAFLPYAGALAGLGEWFCQLWALTFGPESAASTPVAANPSHLPFFLAGPDDKLVTFVTVDKSQQNLEIPDGYADAAPSLPGRSFKELLEARQQTAAAQLVQAGRPSLTLQLPEINPFTIGQLIYLLEVTKVIAAGLFGVKVGDQPTDREARRQANNPPPALEKYRIT
jgi:glucose-6-phosphate isomerase